MPMKIEKMNKRVFKLGDDEYWIEAPQRMPAKTRIESFVNASGKKCTRAVSTGGKKLRWGVDSDGKPEPIVWNLYRMSKKTINGNKRVCYNSLQELFEGSLEEAISACETHKNGE